MNRRGTADILLRIGFALSFLGTMALTLDVYAQNIERGRMLYENHCQVCHTSEVHGRKKRVAIGITELRAIVARWQANQKLNWNAEEIEDVVQFLATTHYFFTTSADRRRSD
jgi:mono/diheme cytochrome c family protein